MFPSFRLVLAQSEKMKCGKSVGLGDEALYRVEAFVYLSKFQQHKEQLSMPHTGWPLAIRVKSHRRRKIHILRLNITFTHCSNNHGNCGLLQVVSRVNEFAASDNRTRVSLAQKLGFIDFQVAQQEPG